MASVEEMCFNHGSGMDTVLLVDVSNKFNAKEFDQLKESLLQFLYISQQIGEEYQYPRDNLALITYSNDAQVIAPFTISYQSLAIKIKEVKQNVGRPKLGKGLVCALNFCDKFGAVTTVRNNGEELHPRIVLFTSGCDYDKKRDATQISKICASRNHTVTVIHSKSSQNQELMYDIARLSGSNAVVAQEDAAGFLTIFEHQVKVLGSLQSYSLDDKEDSQNTSVLPVKLSTVDSEDSDEVGACQEEFKQGDRVRVKTAIKKPFYGWGAVQPGDVGVVICNNEKGDIEVEFPEQAKWTGRENELEVVKDSPKPKETFLKPKFQKGDSVKIRRSIQKPHYGWGTEQNPEDVGRFIGYDQDGDVIVAFPSKQRWLGLESEIFTVTPPPSNI